MYVHDLVHQGRPGDIAVIDHDRRMTYEELAQAVRACRDRLYSVGVRQGDRVGIFSRNCAEYIYAYLGIVSLGAIAVPINFQLSSRETAYILKDAGIEHLLTSQTLHLVDALAAMRSSLQVTQHDLRSCGTPKPGIKPAPPLGEFFSVDNPCVIIYTSGTTGSPKGAVLSHRNLITNVKQIGPRLHMEAYHRSLCVLPMYHCFGWTCSVLYPLYAGASIVILDSFTPKETIATIRDEGITDACIVPSICSLLTKLASKEDMKTLRLVVSGGTALPQKIEQDFREKFEAPICEGYGLSEASPVVTMNPCDNTRTGSIGPVVPDIDWRIISGDGSQVPLGETGELIIRGANVMLGYWNLEEATKETLRGGWLHTGDIVRADADGYIYIVDRIKDMIISMGENIYPREVEELIYQFPGISEVAVIGIEDKLRGQAGACFYSVNKGVKLNVRELKKFLQANLALFKIPREFHEVDKLPRTSTGKIAKRVILKDFYGDKK